MGQIVFFIVLFIASGIGIGMSIAMRGIVSEGKGSDADKQIFAAAHSREWRWPSDMHRYAGGKALLKDIGIVGLVAMQRMLGDDRSFYPMVVFCTIANVMTAVLLYVVAAEYWGEVVGFILFLFYITSVWSYQVILQGGYQVVGAFFFLFSIYALQLATSSPSFLWYFFSGIGFGLMMFSSASSRKFVPLFMFAFLYSQYPYLFLIITNIHEWQSLFTHFGLVLLGTYVLLLIAAVIALHLFRHSLILQERFRDTIRARRVFTYCIRYLLVYALINMALSRMPEFYIHQFLVLVGAFVVGFVLTFPRCMENLKHFYSYWTISDWKPHLLLWKDYFSTVGKPLQGRQNGVGLRWYPKFFLRMIPFHYFFYCISLVSVFYFAISKSGQSAAVTAFLVIGISIAPIVYSEITRGPQFARTNFPIFFGLLFFIGYTLFLWNDILFASPDFWVFFSSIVIVSIAWNVWVFFSDIFPARMAIPNMLRLLRSLGVKEFHTYRTCYNGAFVDALPDEEKRKFTIHYVKTLHEVQDGYIVVPPTSSKAVSMESVHYAIQRGDFREDPFLDQLIMSRTIVKYAVAKIKTVGTSRMWAQESDATSYRDLIAHDISEEDRWRGYAWILDAKKIHTAYGTSQNI